MLYLGIDQHARQITISLRNEECDVIQARQVSTRPEKINEFFEQLTRERLRDGESFVAVLEVGGFGDWLIDMLYNYRCHKVIVIQPDDRKKQKTDRRDAASLSELLWVNRGRLLHGKPVKGLRQVDIASKVDQENRRLTVLRRDARRERTRIINKIKYVLRRHNLMWHMPTKTFPTIEAINWIKKLSLPKVDRLEMDYLLSDLEHIEHRIKELETVIGERCASSKEAVLLTSMPGVGRFTAIALACRVGRIERFPRSHSLANYWGLTPGCRDGKVGDSHLAHAEPGQNLWRVSPALDRTSPDMSPSGLGTTKPRKKLVATPKLDPPASLTSRHPSESCASPGGEPRRTTGRRSLHVTNKETLANPKFSQGCSIRSATADRDPSRLGQLECNRRCGDWSPTRANRTSQLDGVALSARNSHQIDTRLQQPCRAADDNRQRYLAKECVGSNRGRQERSQLPAATTTELNLT